MKKIVYFNMLLLLLMLCGCSDTNISTLDLSKGGIKDTQFIFDTIVTLSADCDKQTLEGAFELCKYYEKLLSRTSDEGDIIKLNSSSGFTEATEETVSIINRALYYSDITKGKFDITVYDASVLWDFNNEVIPSRDEIAEALKNIDYQSIKVNNNLINLNGKKIDLGGIAKGYIADRLLDYFKKENAENININLGGNIALSCEEDCSVGIKKPFSGDDIAAVYHTNGEEISLVTSGIYERFFKKDGIIYHHIIDPKTGHPVDTDLYSATIISKSSLDADALSTSCVLLGLEKAKELIEATADTEAIFIDKNGKIKYTSGLYREDIQFFKKQIQ